MEREKQAKQQKDKKQLQQNSAINCDRGIRQQSFNWSILAIVERPPHPTHAPPPPAPRPSPLASPCPATTTTTQMPPTSELPSV